MQQNENFFYKNNQPFLPNNDEKQIDENNNEIVNFDNSHAYESIDPAQFSTHNYVSL